MKQSNMSTRVIYLLLIFGFVAQAENPSDFAEATTDMSINSQPSLLRATAGFAGRTVRSGCSTFSYDNLQSLIAGVCEIYEEVSSGGLSACAAIPINQTDFNQPDPHEEYASASSSHIIPNNAFLVPQSGDYCLTEDVIGSIIIDNLTNVTIDLNGFSITNTFALPFIPAAAIQFDDTVTHATIKNGTINSAIYFNAGTFVDIKLVDLNITGAQIGLLTGGEGYAINSDQAANFSYVSLENVTTASLAFAQFFANNIDLRLRNCNFAGGLNIIADSITVDIAESVFDNSGLAMTSNGGYGVIRDAIFEAGGGFFSDTPNIILLDCTSLNNSALYSSGFFMNTSSIDIIERSIAINNSYGDGFTILADKSLIRHCIAESNSAGYGFNVTGSAVEVLDCVACNNGTNYNGGVSAPVLMIGGTHFGAGYNVSCD